MSYIVNPDGTISLVRPFRKEEAERESMAAREYAEEAFSGLMGQ